MADTDRPGAVDQPPIKPEDLLFHRAADPAQQTNLWHTETEQRARMLALLSELMIAEGTPPEQFDRLGVPR